MDSYEYEQTDKEAFATFVDEPNHRPYAPEAPIPGVHHYSGCDPDGHTVSPEGICRGCGEAACAECGKGAPCDCAAEALAQELREKAARGK